MAHADDRPAPARMIDLGPAGHLLIDVDGGLAIHHESEEILTLERIQPFPAPVAMVAHHGAHAVFVWLDYDLLIGRMAHLDLTSPLQQGVDRSTVRTAQGIEDAPHPAGAIWSHVLDAEPVALSADEQGVLFVLSGRGIYGMTWDGVERFRHPIPADDGQIISVAPVPTGYRTISNSGAWWLVGPDGGITDQGNLDPDQVLLGVYEHPIGGILVHSVSEVLWFDHRMEPMAIISTNGPLRDAQWDDDVGWRITGWRQDLLLSVDGVQMANRRDLGIAVNNGKVLTNLGQWTPFLDGS